jgi:hypothetical protein
MAPGVCLALLILASLCAGLASAQQPPKLHPTSVPRSIVAPDHLVAGAPATLAVLDSQGRLLANVEVELSGGQKVTTDLTGRALFVAPSEPGLFVAKISALGIAASANVLTAGNSGASPALQGSPTGVNILSYPHILVIHDRFALEGSGFRGAADSNHVYLNGDPCLVLASSPVSLVVLPGPRAPVGDVSLHVTVAGMDAGEYPVSAVLLEFSGPNDAVNAGSSGKLILHAHGTTEPLQLEVRNGSPGVIQLSKGNVQRIKTSGGDENAAPVDVQFVSGGNYLVSARLLPADASLPELDLARSRLAAARKIASGDWPARIDQVLLTMDRAPEDLPQIRAELKSLLDAKPAAPLASLLDSAWRELN